MTSRHERSFAVAQERATAGEPLDVYDDRAKLWALLPVAAAFVAIGVAMFENGQQILGGIAAAFFFVAGLAIAWRLIDSSAPAVRFDAESLTIRRSGKSLRIAWSDLRSVYIASIQNQRFVCLAPRNSDAMLASAPRADRVLMRANIALIGAPYALPTAVGLDVDELLSIVHTYAPALASETTDH